MSFLLKPPDENKRTERSNGGENIHGSMKGDPGGSIPGLLDPPGYKTKRIMGDLPESLKGSSSVECSVAETSKQHQSHSGQTRSCSPLPPGVALVNR